MNADHTQIQREVCAKYGLPFVPVTEEMKVGISRNVQDGLRPLNGLRHEPVGDSSGWYIWAGDELSQAPNFFVPLHMAHLSEWCADAIPYLALPPGSRFLVAPGFEDVWLDRALLEPGL